MMFKQGFIFAGRHLSPAPRLGTLHGSKPSQRLEAIEGATAPFGKMSLFQRALFGLQKTILPIPNLGLSQVAV